MGKRVAFIGHNWIRDEKVVKEKLYKAIEKEIEGGCKFFTMGTHGNFDACALSICRKLRKIYTDITIEVVLTSLNQLSPMRKYNKFFENDNPYEDVQTIIYDIEDTYFKRKITESNRQMIENCDTLICYVDTNYKYASGAKTAYRYAKKLGLKIINIF